jgi:hypothetical protein
MRRTVTPEPVPPAVRQIITDIVDAVHAGDDTPTNRLLHRLAFLATPGALHELRRRLNTHWGTPE